MALQWRHNGRDGVSNHQPRHSLLNRLFSRRSKKTSKLRVTGLCEGNSPVTGEFPAQIASYAENVSIWWRHHGILALYIATCVFLLFIIVGHHLQQYNLWSSLPTLRLVVIKIDSIWTVSVLVSSSHYMFVAHVKLIDVFKHCFDEVLRSYIRLILWYSNRQDNSCTALTRNCRSVIY